MRLSLIFIAALSITSVHASWFGSNKPQYTQWSTQELKQWLIDHHVPIPNDPEDIYTKEQLQHLVRAHWDSASAWTYDQYTQAQKTFADLRESVFDTWTESRLRQFLLEHGVVAPSGQREQLVLLAKAKYRAYTDAARSFSSQASATVSSAVYGSGSVTESASSASAQATKEAMRVMDDTMDYVYSTWNDNQLWSYLEEKGYVKTKGEKKRDELLQMMKDAYAKVADPVWEAWSTSYMHEWLVSHNIIRSDFEKIRDALAAKMSTYYYNVKDEVYSSWSDSELKAWLVEHNIIKSDAQVRRDKLLKLMEDNYANAKDTIWSAWSDSQLRDWLIEHGYMRSDAQVKRDELVRLIDQKYHDASTHGGAYLTWPDARLRAYLREKGVDESALPTSRPGLLQEVRIRWVQTQTQVEKLFARIRDVVNGGVEAVEETLGHVLEILTSGAHEGSEYTGTKYHEAKRYGNEMYDEAKEYGKEKYEEGRGYASDKVAEGRRDAGEYVKKAGEKITGEL